MNALVTLQELGSEDEVFPREGRREDTTEEFGFSHELDLTALGRVLHTSRIARGQSRRGGAGRARSRTHLEERVLENVSDSRRGLVSRTSLDDERDGARRGSRLGRGDLDSVGVLDREKGRRGSGIRARAGDRAGGTGAEGGGTEGRETHPDGAKGEGSGWRARELAIRSRGSLSPNHLERIQSTDSASFCRPVPLAGNNQIHANMPCDLRSSTPPSRSHYSSIPAPASRFVILPA